MTHEKIRLNVAGSAPSAAMYTYFLDLSPEVPIDRRPTVIVCPGGGYAFTSDREAEPIAMRLNAAGMNAVVVRYSVAPARFPTALLEVASAVRYVRETGVQYGCDPDRVFLIGFSAGGRSLHLNDGSAAHAAADAQSSQTLVSTTVLHSVQQGD